MISIAKDLDRLKVIKEIILNENGAFVVNFHVQKQLWNPGVMRVVVGSRLVATNMEHCTAVYETGPANKTLALARHHRGNQTQVSCVSPVLRPFNIQTRASVSFSVRQGQQKGENMNINVSINAVDFILSIFKLSLYFTSFQFIYSSGSLEIFFNYYNTNVILSRSWVAFCCFSHAMASNMHLANF